MIRKLEPLYGDDSTGQLSDHWSAIGGGGHVKMHAASGWESEPGREFVTLSRKDVLELRDWLTTWLWLDGNR